MCNEQTLVYVKIPADLSSTRKEKWKNAQIDKCIAPIVKALQDANIDMRGSCCGHGKREGNIYLEDGRGILILSEKDYEKYLTNVNKNSLPIVQTLDKTL